MLLDFSVTNYSSFAEVNTLYMTPTVIKEFPDNILSEDSCKSLSIAAIYGANASGKSNLLNAIATMRDLIVKDAKRNSAETLPYNPFLFQENTAQALTRFEIEMRIEGVTYRYGMEYNAQKIDAEWLFETPKKSERVLFLRDNQTFEISNHFKEGKGLEHRTRENGLFLSVVDQFNGQIAKKIVHWFSEKLNIISGITHDFRNFSLKLAQQKEHEPRIKKFFAALDVGFEDFKIVENGKKIIETKHTIFNAENQAIAEKWVDMKDYESSGTNKLFDLSGPIFDTLAIGGVLVVDELDAKLHPLLTLGIIDLFQNKVINDKNAQLIFTTHETFLLNKGELRRDQINFVEKDRFGKSELYQLVRYREDGEKIRNDRSFEKDYLAGSYGAAPFLGDLEILKILPNTTLAQRYMS